MNMINMNVNMGNGFHANWNRSLRQGPNIDMRVGNSHAIDKLRAGGAGNVFGAQCSVTISREGRKLSAQMREQQPKSFAAAGAERLLLRQQRQDKMDQSEQSDTLSEISGLMQEIKRYNAAGEDKETITARQDALNRLFELKARQEEENDRRLKDAAGSVAGASKDQEEIDRKNADLYLMLKSLEEEEEGEEERVEGSDAESDTADDGSDDMQFQESASMLGASAAKRELEVTGMIDGMFESGYGKLAQADAMMRDAQAELGLAAEALGRAELSEAEQNQLMAESQQYDEVKLRGDDGTEKEGPSGDPGREGSGAQTYRSLPARRRGQSEAGDHGRGCTGSAPGGVTGRARQGVGGT